MVGSPPRGLHPLSILETRTFLEHDISNGRMDEAVGEGVTVSAIPDGSGGTRWEAQTADGKALRVFRLKIEPVMAAEPVIVPASPTSVYVCYEDETSLRSWCVEVRTD